MKTIRIIDLLNEANNGNIIKKIKHNCIGYEFDEEQCDWFNYDEQEGLLDNLTVLNQLNDEVEIIEEEKEIEKLEPLKKDWMTLGDIKFVFSNSEMILVKKINELIEAINSINKGK